MIASWILNPKSGKCRDHVLPVGYGPPLHPRIGREGGLVQWWSVYPDIFSSSYRVGISLPKEILPRRSASVSGNCVLSEGLLEHLL